MMFKFALPTLLTLVLSSTAWSQSKVSPLKRADLISVKASLEDMLVRRYTQELSSIVHYDHFNIGARFELNVDDGKKKRSSSYDELGYTDLDLSYLNAEELFENYSIPGAGDTSPLEKYSVKKLEIQVGLQPSVSEETQKRVQDWLSARVKKEFGSIGKATVQYINNPDVVDKGSFLKKVKDLQGIFGNLILAIAILLGVLMWRLLSGKEEKSGEPSAAVNIQNNNETAAPDPGGLFGSAAPSESTESAKERVAYLCEQIKELAPKMVDQVDELIKEWCDQGELGLYSLATFAEIAGSTLGTLPIPEEHKKKMGAIFSEMHKMENEKRVDILNKTYWDLVASLNLGADSLHQPFSFINNAALSTVNQVLLGNDVDTQTVVTLYMPDSMRKDYFEELEWDKKVELLNSAAKLSTITEESLHGIEGQIAPYFEDKVDESEVSMSLTLSKLIKTMSLIDACRILPTIEGPVIEKFKASTEHLAFVSEWGSEALNTLATSATNEELLAYLRVVPDMKNHMIEFVSPRAQQILVDDLEQEDTMSDEDKERLLVSMNQRVQNLVKDGAITFGQMFKKDDNNKDQDTKIAA